MARERSELLRAARAALSLSQVGFAELAGASRRTGQRWDGGQATPAAHHYLELARHLVPLDPALAAELAEAAGTTLAAAGLSSPPPPSVAAAPVEVPTVLSTVQIPIDVAIDSLVCAAAEAGDLTPAAVRPILRAAFSRALALQASLAQIEASLRLPTAAEQARAT